MKYLAKQYGLTGGEIALIVRNAATRAARKGDRIHQEDFIQACEDELAGSFDEERAGGQGFERGWYGNKILHSELCYINTAVFAIHEVRKCL